MTKHEFLERLDLLLTDLPQEERMDAIWYYEDYFADAGPENEEQVLKELGSPESVAEKIRAGWKQTGTGQGEEPIGNVHEESIFGEGAFEETSRPRWEEPRKSSLRPLFVLLALIFIGFPVMLPILFVFFIMFCVFFFGFGIAGVALVAVGITLIGSGVANMAFGIGIGMMCIGAGLIVAALGILFIVFAVNCAFRMIPSLIRGSVSLIRRLLFGREVRYETI